MSDKKPAAADKGQSDIWKRVANDQIEMTAETHGISMLLLSPSSLGKAYTRQDQQLIDQALANLNLSQQGKEAAKKLMDALKVELAFVKAISNTLKGAYAGSEPHPDDNAAKAIIAKLKELP